MNKKYVYKENNYYLKRIKINIFLKEINKKIIYKENNYYIKKINIQIKRV